MYSSFYLAQKVELGTAFIQTFWIRVCTDNKSLPSSFVSENEHSLKAWNRTRRFWAHVNLEVIDAV